MKTDTPFQDGTTSSSQEPSSRSIQIPSESLQLRGGSNQAVGQGSYLQRNRERNNGKKESKKKTKPTDLTLLEILCADFENGAALLSKRTGAETDVGHKPGSVNLGQGRFKKGQITELENKPALMDSDESLKFKGNVGRAAQSRSSKSSLETTTRWGDGDTTEDSNNSRSRLKSVSSEGVSFDNSSTESRISEWCQLSSQETSPLRDRFAQTVGWTSEDSTNNCEQGEGETSLQTVSLLDKKHKPSEKLTVLSASSADARMNEKSILSSRDGLFQSSRESQTSENYRFVHFKEGRKPARRKDKKENYVGRSKAKEKLKRTRSSGVKLFQVEGLRSSQKRKSQVRPTSRGVTMEPFVPVLIKTKTESQS